MGGGSTQQYRYYQINQLGLRRSRQQGEAHCQVGNLIGDGQKLCYAFCFSSTPGNISDQQHYKQDKQKGARQLCGAWYMVETDAPCGKWLKNRDVTRCDSPSLLLQFFSKPYSVKSSERRSCDLSCSQQEARSRSSGGGFRSSCSSARTRSK